MNDDEEKQIERRSKIADEYVESRKVKQLDEDELKELRSMMREYQNAAWLKKKVQVWLPWMLGSGAGLFGLFSWFWNGGSHK